MKIKLLALTLLLSIANSSQAIIIHDFNDWTAVNPNGGFESGTWSGQVSSNAGVTVVGGTADNTGSVYMDAVGAVPKDLTSFTQLRLTASVDLLNAAGSFTIVLTDTNGEDAASALFLASDFTNSFTAVSKSLNIIDLSKFDDINGFFILGGGTTDLFKFSFDTLEAVTVPEPSTYVLIGLGLGALVLLRRKAKKA